MIVYSKQSEKFFEKHEKIRNVFEHMIENNPRSVSRPIINRHNTYYRIRIGGWRVVYEMDKGVHVVWAGPRGEAYRKLAGCK